MIQNIYVRTIGKMYLIACHGKSSLLLQRLQQREKIFYNRETITVLNYEIINPEIQGAQPIMMKWRAFQPMVK